MDKPTRLKRILFRSSHRGSKETDIILKNYAARSLGAMDDAGLDLFEAFLDEDDADIWDWVAGASDPVKPQYTAIVAELRAYYAFAR